MLKTSKYFPLTAFLQTCQQNSITFTFNEIEKNFFTLPNSAHNYAALWYDGHGGPLSKSWLQAGYHSKVNMKAKQVTFIKYNFNDKKLTRETPNNFEYVINQQVLSADMIIEKSKAYNASTQDDVFTRFRSWEHCHKAFQKHLFDENYIDYLALHLAWYLASWGMLRNSFLVNFDYTIHKDLLYKISNLKFKPLFYINTIDTNIIDLIFEVVEIIINTYSKYSKSKLTDTFITKILLGIFGCTPAYDRYFKTGAKVTNICNPTFNKHSLEQLWNYYIDNIECFEKARIDLSTTSTIDITPMKLIDMGLWQIGKEKDDSQ